MAKQAEKIRLRNPECFNGVILAGLNQLNQQYAFPALTPIPNQTNVLNTIGNNNGIGYCAGGAPDENTLPANTSLIAVTDPAAILTRENLDLCSGANPAAMTNMIYGTIGWNFDWCAPMFVGVGGSYEFTPVKNTALNRWTVWGKWGVSF